MPAMDVMKLLAKEFTIKKSKHQVHNLATREVITHMKQKGTKMQHLHQQVIKNEIYL